MVINRSFREADGPLSIDEHDEAVFTVEQLVDQFMNSASVTAQCLSKRHDHTSRAVLALAEASSARCSCFSRVRLDARPVSAASDTGSRAAAPAFERRVDSFAQERRNVSSSARAPKIAMASDQSARASAWGHSRRTRHSFCLCGGGVRGPPWRRAKRTSERRAMSLRSCRDRNRASDKIHVTPTPLAARVRHVQQQSGKPHHEGTPVRTPLVGVPSPKAAVIRESTFCSTSRASR